MEGTVFAQIKMASSTAVALSSQPNSKKRAAASKTAASTPFPPPMEQKAINILTTTSLSASACSTGVAAASYSMGLTVPGLPGGCINRSVADGAIYYLGGNAWFSPSYGANGV